MRRALVSSMIPILLALSLLPAPATANSVTTVDRDRARGPLSLAKLETGHRETRYEGRQSTLTITFDEPVRPRQWGPKDFVVIDADGDGKGKSERWIYVFARGGRLYTMSYDPQMDWVHYDENWLRRPTPRSIKLNVSLEYDYEGHFYRVGSYSKDDGRCSQACWDAVPNRGWLVHDNVAPALYHLKYPEWALDGVAEISWRFGDRGYSGVRRSTLFAGELGERDWRRVVSMPGSRRAVRVVPAADEGSQMIFRLHAEDGNGNEAGTGVFGTRVPLDQTNPAARATFVGVWLEEDSPESYGGSVHTSTTTFDSFTFGGKGNLFCVILRAGEGEATISEQGSGGTTFSAWDQGGGRHIACHYGGEVREKTVEVEVDSGTISIDAYWVGLTYDQVDAAVDRPLPEPKSAPGRSSGAAVMPLGDLLDAATELRPR